MSGGLILAIDQGTTNTKALALDPSGAVVAQASAPMPVTYPRPGWAEQSALDIWASVQAVIGEVLARVRAPIDALAISNQRETIIVWEAATGRPIAPAVIWQCRRSAARCAALREAGHAGEILDRTGLSLDPLFPAAKIAWILDEVPGARQQAEQGRLRAGTVDSWLLWNLTGGRVHATDHSNASRTQLFSTRSLAWDERLGELFAVPLAILPRVLRSDSRFGETAEGATALPAGTPIHAMIGDSHAALFGHGITQPGTVKATYGTGSSLMTLTPTRIASSHGLSGTIAWSTRTGVAYALEGNISVSGQAASFIAGLLGLADAEALTRLARSVPDSKGVTFVPALVGLGAPHWRDDARGLISGLALGTGPAHLARAALEAIAFQVADVFDAMQQDLGLSLSGLSVDGGASRNDFLMQFQADILDRRVVRSPVAELSAIGAARMANAGLGRDSWATGEAKTFLPAIPQALRDRLRTQWADALGRALLG